MTLKTLILFICVGPGLVLAAPDACGTDLNKGQSSPFNSIPIYDQDGMGMCYAYSVSQMIDYYRLSHGEKGLTNPVYAGWATYYKNVNYFKSRSLNNGGQEHHVVDALKKVGVCDNKLVRKRLSALTLDIGLTEAQSLHFLETMYQNYNGIFSSKNWETAFHEITSRSQISCQQGLKIKNRLEKAGLLDVAPTYILERLFEGCKPNPVKIPDVETLNTGSDEGIADRINDTFKRKLPIAIALCSSFFKNNQNRDLRGIGYGLNRGSRGNIKAECGLHAVLLTAQKNINGECNYLIRNSWGASWYPNGATSCACITWSGVYKQICQKGEGSEYVGCWFKKKDVLPNAGSVLFSSNATSEVNEAHKKVVCQSATWHIGNADAEICYDTTLSAYFSKKCFESVCDAKTIKTEAGSLKISIEEKNPNHNPGSIVCIKLKGEVVIGRNPRGSEIVFCKATDGSLVDLSSLGK